MSRADVPPFLDYAPWPIGIPHSPLSTGVKGGAKCTGAAKQDSTSSTSTGATANLDSNCREAVYGAATPFRAPS